MSEKPFGRLDIPGSRPDAAPVERGAWEAFTVYLAGDLVEDEEGRRWRALRDYKSGYLPPAVVEADHPGTIWERITTRPASTSSSASP